MTADKMSQEFSPGAEVVYGLHGRCSVSSVEEKKINGESIRFYKLQPQKPALSRSKKQEPAIWLPVSAAAKKGLRNPIEKSEIDRVFAILGNQESYFSVEDSWEKVHPKLEMLVFDEGPIGLAKAESYLYFLRKKQIVPSQEVARFSELVRKVLVREIAEVTEQPIRAIEEKMDKSLKAKDKLDH